MTAACIGDDGTTPDTPPALPRDLDFQDDFEEGMSAKAKWRGDNRALLSPAEAAEIVGMTEADLLALASEGAVPGSLLSRAGWSFSRAVLSEFIRAGLMARPGKSQVLARGFDAGHAERRIS